VVPTKSHFIPLFAIVIQGPQKSGAGRVNITNKFSTIDDVPKMAVKYMFIYINVAILTGSIFSNLRIANRGIICQKYLGKHRFGEI
jgi:hypothetical protein